jgi:hypothetical protein
MNSTPLVVLPDGVLRHLQAVVAMAQHTVPCALVASITLVTDAGAATVASTSDWAGALDRAQYAAGFGPCVEASVGGETREMIDAGAEVRWPSYVAAALRRGALSSVSIPIPADNEGVVGSLNAFAADADAFTSADRLALFRLAGTAAATLTGTAGSAPVTHRQRAVVDQAKGILMSRDHCTPTQALDALSTAAAGSGRSLRDAAAELVRTTTTL